jgi:eukaryotic-like serine/threonine-protein kinase
MATDTQIGSYTILRPLGKGGTAEVFLAERGGPGQFKKQVAIKRILRALLAQKDIVQMFLDEARLVARFNHPNVAQLHELGNDNGQYFVVMEYVAGRALDDIIDACAAAKRPFPAAIAAKIVSLTCEALQYAHEFRDEMGAHLKIIHRDVSPQNIMLSYDGVVKVVDFGIAKAAVNYYQTRVGTLKGKLDYMSPEQIRQNVLLDHRTDLFSLGAVLYELLAGRRPFVGATDLAVMSAIVRDPPPEIPTGSEVLAAPLAKIAMRALAKDRAQRFETARQMQLAIEQCLGEHHVVVDTQTLAGFLREVLPPVETLAPEIDDESVTEMMSPAGLVPRPEDDRPDRDATNPSTRLPTARRPSFQVGVVVLLTLVVAAGAAALWKMGPTQDVQPIVTTRPPPPPSPARPATAGPLSSAVPTPAGSRPAAVDAVGRDEDYEPTAGGKSRRGLLVVHTDPPTDVWIDGRPATQGLAGGVEVKAGPHAVSLMNKKLGILLRQQVEVRAGKTTRLSRTIGRGSLLVFASPYGQVFVDDRDVGLTPMDAPVDLYEGEHALRVVCGRTTRENVQLIRINADSTLRVKVDLR